MFGIKKLKQNNEYMGDMIDMLTAQNNMLMTRFDTQAKIRSAASKRGWHTRRNKCCTQQAYV